MIEAFERHLKELSFQRQFENAKTVEDKLAFCRSFIKKHDPTSMMDRESRLLERKLQIDDTQMLRLSMKADVDRLSETLRRQASYDLLQEAEKFVLFTTIKRPHQNDTIIHAKLGVFKP